MGIYFQIEKMSDLKDDYKQIFNFYDRNTSGTLTHEEMKSLISEAGIELNPEDMKTFFDGVEDPVDVDRFMAMFSNFCVTPYSDVQIVNAFKTFDKAGTGFANAGELRYVLTTLGKGINKAQVEDIILQSKTDDQGNIDYKDFAVRLVGRGADNHLIIPPPAPEPEPVEEPPAEVAQAEPTPEEAAPVEGNPEEPAPVEAAQEEPA